MQEHLTSNPEKIEQYQSGQGPFPKPDSSALRPFLEEGLGVLPLHRPEARRTIQKPDGTIKVQFKGKTPLHKDWVNKRYRPAKVIEHMDGGGNVGIQLPPDIVVVDVDPRHFAEGDDPLARLAKDYDLDLDNAPTVITGSGGKHIYFTKPADMKVQNGLEGYEGIEFKSHGREVVAPGSIHPETMKPYKWDVMNDDLSARQPLSPSLLECIESVQSTSGGEPGEYTPEQIEAMLDSMAPEHFDTNDVWEPLMMAVHQASGGMAGEEFVAWSTQDPDYADDAEIIRTRWDSLSVSKNGAKRGGGTLRQLVIKHGDQETIPRTSAAEDFSGELLADEALEDDPGHSSLGVLDRGLQVARTGKANDNITNAMIAVERSGTSPVFNELTQRGEFKGKLPWDVKQLGREYDEHTLRQMRKALIEKFQGNDYQPSKENVAEAIQTLSKQHPFNPVKEYLAGVQWDGETRINSLFSVGFGCPEDEYTRAVSRAFVIGAVARAHKPGCKLDEMPVLQGPQGVGKSTGIRALFGEPWFSDAELGRLDAKDAVLGLAGHWAHEFAELNGWKKTEAETLKSFLSRQVDEVRKPYAREVERFPRRCVFIGTTNAGGYLADSTGGRRFWPLRMEDGARVDLMWLRGNRDQLWAEAYASFCDGEPWTLPQHLWSEATDRQKAETVEDPWADTLRSFLAARAEGKWHNEIDLAEDVRATPPPAERVHSRELFDRLGLVDGKRERRHELRLREVMESLGWMHAGTKLKIHGKAAAGYRRE